jgi:hypothetical protein
MTIIAGAIILEPRILASLFRRFASDYSLSLHQISCYVFHNWLPSSNFSPTGLSPRSRARRLTRTSTSAPADIIRGFDTLKRLRTTTPCAAAGQSRTTASIDSLFEIGAITRRGGHRNRPVFPKPNCQKAGGDTPPS